MLGLEIGKMGGKVRVFGYKLMECRTVLDGVGRRVIIRFSRGLWDGTALRFTVLYIFI